MVNGFKKSYNRLLTTNHEPRTNHGFTLIELLIVIALIGILSSFGVFSYQSSQKKARDAQRKSDLQQVKRALETGKNDCRAGSYYPVQATSPERDAFINTISRLKTTKYLQGDIQDDNYGLTLSSATAPICPASGGSLSWAGAKNYVLRAKLEISKDPDTASSYSECLPAINKILGDTYLFTDPQPNNTDSYYYVCPD